LPDPCKSDFIRVQGLWVFAFWGGSEQVLAGGRSDQLAVLDPFGADQFIGQPFDVPGLALDHHHFEAMVIVEVDVQRRNDGAVVMVLAFGEFVGEVAGVMIVNQGDGADDFLILAAPLVLDQSVGREWPRNGCRSLCG